MERQYTKICPECGSPMVKRIARRGAHAGNSFWGCSQYPRCKCIVNFDDLEYATPSDNAFSGGTAGIKNSFQKDNLDDKTSKSNKRIDYIAAPYNGFCYMESFNSLGVSKNVLKGINNDTIPESDLQQYSCFRVDFSGNDINNITSKQRQICSLAMRMLCRGDITINSAFVEEELNKLYSQKNESTLKVNEWDYCTHKKVEFAFDSENERFFAEMILQEALGEYWQDYTATQVLISSLVDEENDLNEQRVDFLVSDGTKDIIFEIDGPDHMAHLENDRIRDSLLTRNGYKVIRIQNDDLRTQTEELVNKIKAEITISDKPQPNASSHAMKVLSHKLVHQAEIAIITALIRGYIDCDSSILLDIPVQLGLDENAITSIVIKDIDEMLQKYCDLYDERKFFKCELGSKKTTDIRIAYGNVLEASPCSIIISDIKVNKRVRNEIPGFSDISIENAPEETLLYFLRYIFRFDTFREGQFVALSRLLERMDSIVLLPTGSGKSLIYQLASFLVPGKIIVVDPLVSLMEDQIFNLHCNGIDCALAISSANREDVKEITNNALTLIYVSPERLQQQEFRNKIDAVQVTSRIYALAIDEAHCVSEWGHDFRTAYLNIGRTTRNVFSYNGACPTLIALTGTASTAVLKDVKRELEIYDYDAIITPETFNREELHFKVVTSRSDDKEQKLRELLNKAIPEYFGKTQSVFYALNGEATNGGIVFCPHVGGGFGVLSANRIVDNSHISSDIYSGKKPKEIDTQDWEAHKKEAARRFKQNKINTLVSTKAFGMGIDKPNVRFTIHYGIPSSIESFYQEAGRAGRGTNVKNALCTIILSDENSKEDDYLLNPLTPLSDIQERINAKRYEENDDVSRMLYFHVNSFKGIDFEMENVESVLDYLFDDDELTQLPTTIGFGEGRTFENQEALQKAIQRLLVLGVVSDYTLDYSQKEIKLYPGSSEKEDIVSKYANYVKGYNEGRVITEIAKIENLDEDTNYEFTLNSARILTVFIYDTIEKGRRRGLREIRNAATAALNSPSPDDTLRQRVVRYFETTYADELNLITDDSNLGFDLIPLIIDGHEIEESKEVVGGIRSTSEASGLRGGASRYLESLPDHPGLLAARALAELLCRDYDVEQVQDDILACCKYATTRYSYSPERLKKFVEYFVSKAVERDSELFYPIMDVVNEYCDVVELSKRLIESTALGEDKKSSPAELYFGNLAKSIIEQINIMKGDK